MPSCSEKEAELLKKFGLYVTDSSGGISVAFLSEIKNNRIHPWNVVTISKKLWGWLLPLLIELDARREKDKIK